MARAPHGTNQPPRIIYKKIYIEGHGGHHGGAWKVAYADFVTAMMAFFLLLWLLGATTEKQRKGIADYFAPTLLNTKSKGVTGGGLFGGDSILAKDPLPSAAPAAAMGNAALVAPTALQGGPEASAGVRSKLRETVVAEDRKNFEAIRRRVTQQIMTTRALRRLANHIRFVPTRDGLRIDLVDDADYSMFAIGTTMLVTDASELIGLIAQTVAPLPNTLMIRGHTDSLPWGDPRAMNNWTLSTGRAEATRRRLALGGLPEARFERIEGVADREPFNVKDPADPRNRRVAITLLYRQGAFAR